MKAIFFTFRRFSGGFEGILIQLLLIQTLFSVQFYRGVVNFICVFLVIMFWMAGIVSVEESHAYRTKALGCVYEPLFGFLNISFSLYPLVSVSHNHLRTINQNTILTELVPRGSI